MPSRAHILAMTEINEASLHPVPTSLKSQLNDLTVIP